MDPKRLRELLEKARAELTLLFEIGNALRTTLDLNEILYIILTGVTSHAGLGFNRAAIFLVSEKGDSLEGRMGIGAETGEEAGVIWEEIQKRQQGLKDLIANYSGGEPLKHSSFHQSVIQMKVPFTELAGGALARVVREGTPLELGGPEAEPKILEDPVLRVFKATRCVLVPLKSRDERVVGVIFADNRITMKPISVESFRLLALLAAHAGLAIENARTYEAALQQADLDPLTGLWNKGAFERLLMEARAVAESSRQPVSLLLLDLDHFKEYNDRVGHLEGDEALRKVARLLKETARQGDIVARYGGEEFAVILPATRKLDALKLAERLRLTMDRTGTSLTLSAGVATFPEDGQESKELLRAADSALYEAKRQGRNRVAIA